MTKAESILQAARADSIPEGESGLWSVKKWSISCPLEVPRDEGKTVVVPAGNYTSLFRRTIYQREPYGELVMHDTPDELRKHLQFMLVAYGNVVITGLGLGCVVRGTLANPWVQSVTVLERDRQVLKLVVPYMPKDSRLKIVRAEAYHWLKSNKQLSFDCAWHDLWSDPDKKERHLAVIHSKLIHLMANRTLLQGAWSFPREYRRAWRSAPCQARML
jgi:hypothetical protein